MLPVSTTHMSSLIPPPPPDINTPLYVSIDPTIISVSSPTSLPSNTSVSTEPDTVISCIHEEEQEHLGKSKNKKKKKKNKKQ